MNSNFAWHYNCENGPKYSGVKILGSSPSGSKSSESETELLTTKRTHLNHQMKRVQPPSVNGMATGWLNTSLLKDDQMEGSQSERCQSSYFFPKIRRIPSIQARVYAKMQQTLCADMVAEYESIDMNHESENSEMICVEQDSIPKRSTKILKGTVKGLFLC